MHKAEKVQVDTLAVARVFYALSIRLNQQHAEKAVFSFAGMKWRAGVLFRNISGGYE
jgi:hypothetical protein